MEIWRWLGENWFTLLQSVGIIGSLLFTAFTLRADAKARRIENLISITSNHRDIWKNLYTSPELSRVIDPAADLTKRSITQAEQVFVKLVILHLSSVYHASEVGVLQPPEGMQLDVRRFLSRPIPNAIWQRIKSLQDRDFVNFVETCLLDNESGRNH